MKTETCPFCGKPAAAPHAPFCSRGCKDRDLLQWLGEGYRIPGPAIDHDGLGADAPGTDGLDRGEGRD